MAYPTWGFLIQEIVATRSYEAGLEGALLLLRYTEDNQQSLGATKTETNFQHLYWLILDMLDRLDRWEEYLSVWEEIRRHTAFVLTYVSEARKRHGQRFEPFILGEERGTHRIRFLWMTVHRKGLIERKLARSRTGRPPGNLKHAPRELLSGTEIERRLTWVVEMAKRASGRAGVG